MYIFLQISTFYEYKSGCNSDNQIFIIGLISLQFKIVRFLKLKLKLCIFDILKNDVENVNPNNRFRSVTFKNVWKFRACNYRFSLYKCKFCCEM